MRRMTAASMRGWMPVASVRSRAANLVAVTLIAPPTSIAPTKLHPTEGNGMSDKESERLNEQRTGACNWRTWGPYLSERQWGTVREDYSASGSAWDYCPHDHARSRAYRWGEDGLLGITDR